MKLRKAWEITTPHGDVLLIDLKGSARTLRWANRYGYGIRRIFVLK